MKIQQIFTPNDTPTVTYVDRSEHKLEQRLRDYFETPNVVVSVSGPSKSGKTVLIKKIIAEDQLIPVVGTGIASAENLWDRVLNWMGAPSETSETKLARNELKAETEIGAKGKIPLIAEGEGKLKTGGSRTWGTETKSTFRHGGLPQVIDEIGGSDFVVFIDDFHYIKPELRDEVGKQIKVAAENGVKIVTASVPHRADDVVRSNPELRGRVAAVDLSYWKVDELRQIARKGFASLNAEVAPAIERRFATEAFGSPQLMQSICLNLCYALPLREPLVSQARIEVDEVLVADTLLRTSTFTAFSKMVAALHAGPRTRGTERKLHYFTDGSRGDVYRAILLAMREDPAELSFIYDNILSRVRAVCIGDSPSGSSVTSALEQMSIIADEVQPSSSPLSWDADTLDVADPYLLFFLRCSGKLAEIGGATFSFGIKAGE